MNTPNVFERAAWRLREKAGKPTPRPTKSRENEWAERTLCNLERAAVMSGQSERLAFLFSKLLSTSAIELIAAKVIDLLQETFTRRNVFVSLNGDPHYKVFAVESTDPDWQRTIALRILELIGPELADAFEPLKKNSTRKQRRT